jgi:hypothetical protein
MNSPSSRSHQGSPSAANLVWLISFGDLLTLLVCFFLVLTPWSKVSFGAHATKQPVNSTLDSERLPGIAFANRSLGRTTSSEPLGEFVLTRNVFGAGQETGLQEVIESVARKVSEGKSGKTRMILEICTTFPPREVLRRVGGGLAERLKAQVALEVEIDGECRAVKGRYPHIENTVGVIRIVHSSEDHG